MSNTRISLYPVESEKYAFILQQNFIEMNDCVTRKQFEFKNSEIKITIWFQQG